MILVALTTDHSNNENKRMGKTDTQDPNPRIGVYFDVGNVLNHQANGVWGVTTKWEF